MTHSIATRPADLLHFIDEYTYGLCDFDTLNLRLKQICGINSFFESKSDIEGMTALIAREISPDYGAYRREYGDFQTPCQLAHGCLERVDDTAQYEFLLEPTCGSGGFIVSALERFPNIRRVVGIEIYKPYVWETKIRILSYYLATSVRHIPSIDIIHANVFSYDFGTLASETKAMRTLIAGNPPWITNSELGSINSVNLPNKTVSSSRSGFGALTGKSNFDLGESVLLTIIKHFQHHDGVLSMLIKSQVAKKIVENQKQANHLLSRMQRISIDAKKEFNVSVSACLFVATLGEIETFTCIDSDYYIREQVSRFGWVGDKFVSSVDGYSSTQSIDGSSGFTWRSGMKHDCSKVMEITSTGTAYTNQIGSLFKLEPDLVYGLLKSSDLKRDRVQAFRRSTIVTQRKIGQDTSYIKEAWPLTYNYLEQVAHYFDKRKSSIYRGKPRFSIFGIGDYSFKPYKVAISGLYTTTKFTLVEPVDSKPVMLDDTCYFIGFDSLDQARIAQWLLNSKKVQTFLNSVVFTEAKRPITKATLMRIDLASVALTTSFGRIKSSIKDLTEDQWSQFKGALYQEKATQVEIF